MVMEGQELVFLPAQLYKLFSLLSISWNQNRKLPSLEVESLESWQHIKSFKNNLPAKSLFMQNKFLPFALKTTNVW